MSDFKITIPKPCHENWDNMTPKEQGKHCCVCEKTVVDFTKMEPREIKTFFEERKTERVCGHFYTSQVHKEIPKFHQSLLKLQSFIEKNLTLPPVKRLALSGLGFVMIMAGCSQPAQTSGDVVPSSSDNLNQIDSTKKDSIKTQVTTGDTTVELQGKVKVHPIPEKNLMTGIMVIQPDTIKSSEKEKTK